MFTSSLLLRYIVVVFYIFILFNEEIDLDLGSNWFRRRLVVKLTASPPPPPPPPPTPSPHLNFFFIIPVLVLSYQN